MTEKRAGTDTENEAPKAKAKKAKQLPVLGNEESTLYTKASMPSSEEVAEAKKLWMEPNKGWTVTSTGRVLLRQASKKYQRPIYVTPGGQIPFNETDAWYTPDGPDHWFELPLTAPELRAETGGKGVPGRLFTTRMPYKISEGLAPDATEKRWRQEDGLDGKETLPEKGTRIIEFLEKVRRHGIKKVFALVEDKEPKEAGSEYLFEFYRERCGLEVCRFPIEDYSTPTRKNYDMAVDELVSSLQHGKNCLVHCWGGSGRTGTVVIGALSQLGLENPIRLARFVKSVYIEVAEQEHFVATRQHVVSKRLFETQPLLAKMELAGKIHALIEGVNEGRGIIQAEGPGYDTEQLALLQRVFNAFDGDGNGWLSISEISSCLDGLLNSNSSQDKSMQDTLISILGQLSPNYNDPKHSDYQAVHFDLFVRLLCTNLQLAKDEAVAAPGSEH